MGNIRKSVNSKEEIKRRAPIFDRRDRTAFTKDDRYYRVWVNDVKGQVQDFLDSGFQFVTEEERWGREDTIDSAKSIDSRASLNVGRAGGQENVTAFLMQIPIDEWNELRKPAIEEAQRPMREIMRQKEEMKRDGYYGDLIIKK